MAATREQLDEGRRVALECITAAQDFWLETKIKADEAPGPEDGAWLAGAVEHLADLQRQWTEAAAPVLDHVTLANAAAAEPIEACGAMFATAWEASWHCAHGPVWLLGDGRGWLQARASIEYIQHARTTDYNGLAARIDAEHARAVAALPEPSEPTEPPADEGTAEQRVLKSLTHDYHRNWTSAELAKATGLHATTVRQTSAWKNWRAERDKQQLQGRGRRGSKTRGGGLEAVADDDWQAEIDERIDRGE